MQTQLRQAVVVAFGRTPYCKARKGSFAQLHPVEYGAQTLLGVLARVPQLRPEDIGDVIMGCAMPFGVQGGNMARLIVQRAGLPDCVTAQTVNRYCSSGLQTIATAANAIRCGEEDVVIAGGVESMSLVPMLVGAEDADPWLAEHRPEVYTTMGITAEMWPASGASAGPIWTPWPLRATAGPPRPRPAAALTDRSSPSPSPAPTAARWWSAGTRASAPTPPRRRWPG